MKLFVFAGISILFLSLCNPADARIYTWVDENGKRHYSNSGFQENPQEAEEVESDTSVQSFKSPPKPPSPPEANIETKSATSNSDLPSTSETDQSSDKAQVVSDKEDLKDNSSSNSSESSSLKSPSQTTSSHTINKTTIYKTKNIRRPSSAVNSSKAIGSQNRSYGTPNTHQNRVIRSKQTKINNVIQSKHDNKIKNRNRVIREENQRRLKEHKAKSREIEKRNTQIRRANERKLKEYNRKVEEVRKQNAEVREHNRAVTEQNARIRKKNSNQNRSSSRKPYLGDNDPNRPYHERHPAERGWSRAGNRKR